MLSQKFKICCNKQVNYRAAVSNIKKLMYKDERATEEKIEERL